MKKYLFLLVLFTTNAFAQTIIKGRVVDFDTKENLPGSSVYINNTSIGTTTASDGLFTLNVNLSGKLELVISNIAYQKQTVLIDEKSGQLYITLKKQDNTLNEVTIRVGKHSKNNLKKWTDLFTQNLLGDYSRSICTLKNPEVLLFDFDQNTNQLDVYASAPLVIENETTGYSMRLDLDAFDYNFNTDEVSYKYSVFFEDLPIVKYRYESIAKMRMIFYYGSSMHLMRSIYAGTLAAEGFKLYEYTAIRNKEKARVSALVQQKIATAYATEQNPKLDISVLFLKKDTASYYKEVMRQPDVFGFDTIAAKLANIITPNEKLGNVALYFADTLMVSYYRPYEQYKKLNKGSQNQISAASYSKVPTDHVLNSFLYFFKKKPIHIEKNGYYPEMGLYIYGNMSTRRLGAMLPWDYDPDKN